MLADVPPLLGDVGAAAAALTAVIILGGLLARSRPVRWVWRTSISAPLAEWFRAQVAHEIEPRLAEVRAELRPTCRWPTPHTTDSPAASTASKPADARSSPSSAPTGPSPTRKTRPRTSRPTP